MRTHTKHLYRCIFLWSAAIALGGAPGIRARAQQNQPSPQTQPMPQAQRQDAGTNTGATDDRANFDQFLAQHKDIAKDLQNKPGLVNDPDYLRKHKDLQTFFDRNPRAHDELRQDSSFFTRRDNQPAPNATPRQRADRDAFLAKHKDIDADLKANPGLVNDNDYLRRHRDLQVYLDRDPGMRDDFRNRPDNDRDRFNDNAQGNPARGNPNPDLTRQELATMDQFLDSHQDIDRQLRANPRLIDDQNFLRANPQLQAFLTQHPVVLNEFRENPNYFMQRENRYDARNPDANLTARQRKDRDDFMAKHKDIDRDLQANPGLVNDNDYLRRHSDLRAFLDKDPDVRERARVNPSSMVPEKNTATPPARNNDVRSDKADIKSDKADIKSDKAKGTDVKSDKADLKADKADAKADKAKPKKPSKPSDTKPPIEQREESQPPVH